MFSVIQRSNVQQNIIVTDASTQLVVTLKGFKPNNGVVGFCGFDVIITGCTWCARHKN